MPFKCSDNLEPYYNLLLVGVKIILTDITEFPNYKNKCALYLDLAGLERISLLASHIALPW